MNEEIKLQRAIDGLLAEYKEIYEYARHDDRISATKEHVYGAVAFTIFGYSNINFNDIPHLAIAAAASLGIWFYHMLSVEIMSKYYEQRFIRIREIEHQLNELLGSEIFKFQTRLDEYRTKHRENRLAILKTFRLRYVNPAFWILTFGLNAKIRPLRSVVTVMLALLWAASIGAQSVANQGTDSSAGNGKHSVSGPSKSLPTQPGGIGNPGKK